MSRNSASLSKGLIDAICVIDLERLKYTYVSESIENLFGYSPDERLTQNIQECMTPESFQKVTKCFLRAIDPLR